LKVLSEGLSQDECVPGPTARLCLDEGATAVEYALMAGLIAMVIITAVVLLGRATSDAMCGPVSGLGGSQADCLSGS
jgi:Flp pilus assembly pilin Flp